MSKRNSPKHHDEPPKKKAKASMERLWTYTNPETGEKGGRIRRIDLDYRILSTRRRTKAKIEKVKKAEKRKKLKDEKKKSKSKSKSQSKDKDKSKTKSKDKSNNNDSDTEQDSSDDDNEEEEEDDDIKTSSNDNDNDIDNGTDGKFYLETKRFDDFVCLVTGSGHDNLGRAVALRLAQEGGIVILLDSQQFNKSIEEITKKCNQDNIYPKLEGYRLNVTDEKACKETVDNIMSKFGYIDVLVNCAGTHGNDRGKQAVDVNNNDFLNVMNVNLFGTFNMCKAVLPYMKEENFGRIINIASVWGQNGRAGHVAFSASKGAVIAMTKSMAKEYAATGITINCVAPGFVDDKAEMKSYHLTVQEMKDEILMHRIGELEEIAGVVAHVASEENTYTTGFIYDISGGVK